MTCNYDNNEGIMTFECDQCGEEETFCDTFGEAAQRAKKNDWWIRKVNGEWVHFCSKQCYLDWQVNI